MSGPFGLGWHPDPPSPDDYDATELLGTHKVNASGSARRLVTKILDQGGLGSCTTNAAMQAVHASHVKQGAPPDVEFGSRLFAYFFARVETGDTQVDSGTYIRAVFDVLNKLGFPQESLWPYSDDSDPRTGRFARAPGMKALRAAYDQRAPTTYRRIYESGYDRIDVIKRAIDAEHLVVFGTNVSEAFCSDMGANGGKPIDPPVGMRLAGGHAMCVGEYNGDDFGIINSWGEQYGDHGWARFSADYLAWRSTTDLWIVESAPRFSEAA